MTPHTLNVTRAELLKPLRPFGGPSRALWAVMKLLRQASTPELLTRLVAILEKGKGTVRISVECGDEPGIAGISERIVIQ
jgi:hypothetical protein